MATSLTSSAETAPSRMRAMLECPWCRQAFLPRSNTQRYCCAECSFADNAYPIPVTGCWGFVGTRLPTGYGQISCGTRKDGTPVNRYAHRFAWELSNGPIPDGLVIDHRVCRNKWCVNPDHMVVCTDLENRRQPDGAVGIELAATHCDRGHPYVADNVRYDRKGHRNCRACQVERWRRKQAKRAKGAANGH